MDLFEVHHATLAAGNIPEQSLTFGQHLVVVELRAVPFADVDAETSRRRPHDVPAPQRSRSDDAIPVVAPGFVPRDQPVGEREGVGPTVLAERERSITASVGTALAMSCQSG